ncbi:MAG: CocE/NonD family hydrolase [Ignavibacteriales bacterium]|nr:CocE/NonD family hydrolase [Ignavibacteriales bacterium]
MKILYALLMSCAMYGQDNYVIEEHYTKAEYRIPMRDGETLFTSVYTPRDTTKSYPLLMHRTPYSVAPYGEKYRDNLGPSTILMKEGYIFVYQDVRGRFMSDGVFEDVRPHNKNKKTNQDVDESSDTYDSIEWLITHCAHNNGKAGLWGISYPGFYAAHGLIDAHPAVKAVSPQAPIGDWFLGDDFHHNGAMFLIDAFNFYRSFGRPRPFPTTTWPSGFQYPTPDGYRFLLNAGSIASLKKKIYGDTSHFWNEAFAHPDYDEFWKARNVPQHMKNIRPAVMVVGGLFDAEDLYGPLHIYQAIRENSPSAYAVLVLGPWSHGGWARAKGDRLGNISFGEETSVYFQSKLELRFFNYFLKGKGVAPEHQIYAFETGRNQWHTYSSWPPTEKMMKKIYFSSGGKLALSPPAETTGYDEYCSNPSRPVPYTEDITNGRGREYMTDDQRFAWQRPDVVSYETDVLRENISVAGPITANLFVSTTGTDADFVVKVIDVFPESAKDDPANAGRTKMGGYQMLVRGEVMRARYRKGFDKPAAMRPNTIEQVNFQLQDIHHTFNYGHKLMVQVQSSWFPLVDRNPQSFVNIYQASESDFRKATQRIYTAGKHASNIELPILPEKP